MSFVKKPFFSRVIDALKDREDLKSPVVIKRGDSMNLEIVRLQKELAEGKPGVEHKRIEK